jgi:hypothetical protein
LGTTRNVQAFVFRLVAEACQHLDLQLVISLGGRFDPEMFSRSARQTTGDKYAPQLELLRLATIVITHGGPNTVFEALMEGKPMVAIPLAHDQPAVAARLARLGIAEVLPVMRLSARKIHRAVTKVLNDPSYRDAAVKMQAELHSLHGLERAADVIEEALQEHALLVLVRSLTNIVRQTTLQCLIDPAIKVKCKDALAEVAILKFVCRDIRKNLQKSLVFRPNLSGRVELAAGALRGSSVRQTNESSRC